MANTGSRRGAADSMSLILMVLSFLAMIGLMFWLSQNAQTTASLIPVEEDPVEARLETVALGDFAMNPMGYTDQAIRLANLSVASRLGNHAFWISVPQGAGEIPFLIHMDSTVYSNLRVSAGETVSIEGMVMVMTPETLDEWEAAGAWENPTNRIEAEFASEYFHATVVEVAGAPTGGAETNDANESN